MKTMTTSASNDFNSFSTEKLWTCTYCFYLNNETNTCLLCNCQSLPNNDLPVMTYNDVNEILSTNAFPADQDAQIPSTLSKSTSTECHPDHGKIGNATVRAFVSTHPVLHPSDNHENVNIVRNSLTSSSTDYFLNNGYQNTQTSVTYPVKTEFKSATNNGYQNTLNWFNSAPQHKPVTASIYTPNVTISQTTAKPNERGASGEWKWKCRYCLCLNHLSAGLCISCNSFRNPMYDDLQYSPAAEYEIDSNFNFVSTGMNEVSTSSKHAQINSTFMINETTGELGNFGLTTVNNFQDILSFPSSIHEINTTDTSKNKISSLPIKTITSPIQNYSNVITHPKNGRPRNGINSIFNTIQNTPSLIKDEEPDNDDSILGWSVDKKPIRKIWLGPIPPTSEWACQFCTYLNVSSAKICDMCENARNTIPVCLKEQGPNTNNNLVKNESMNNLRKREISENISSASSPKRVCSVPSASTDIFSTVSVTSTSTGILNSEVSRKREQKDLKEVTEATTTSSIIPSSNDTEVTISGDQVNNNEEKPHSFFQEPTLNDSEKLKNYLELETFYNMDLIICMDHFECSVCLCDYYPGDGITLKDCLHTFCRECLVRAVECNTDAAVKCPFSNENYQCSSILQDREIKALVGPEAYEKHLTRSVNKAEQILANTYHCKTADCDGWCIYEGNTGLFKCPVCNQTNCLDCDVIHTNMTCEEYKAKIHGLDDEASINHLEKLIKSRKAMECPRCKAVITKYGGCDGIFCSVCKIEICWATRGARWGPKGRGDISGGCRCGVGGKKCHPKCRYCH